MNIRRLNQTDATMYQKIRLNALLENPEYYSSSYEEERERSMEMIKERLSQNHIVTYGAFIHHELVAIITLAKEQRNKTKHIADIFGMFVDKNHRRKGIAKALILHVIEVAKNQEIKRIRLSVTDSNQGAYQLYEQIGFTTYGVEPNAIFLNQKYFNSILMNLDL